MKERDEETYSIIGAAMAVHRELGCGFLEAVYQEAMAIELLHDGIPHLREVALPIQYRSQTLSTVYRADFVCFDAVIVELKATDGLNSRDEAQLLNYLKASGKEKGLLLNFGSRSLEYKRMVHASNLRESV
jgi:GxxExxY protein